MIDLSTPQPQRHPNPTVKAQRIAYLIWERKNLKKAKKFLVAFGLHVMHENSDAIYFRGTEKSPFCYVVKKSYRNRFVGFGLEVKSIQDLKQLTKLSEASVISELKTPGGGYAVSLTDPSGFVVHAVYGQKSTQELASREILSRNTSFFAPRINSTQRIAVAAPDVIKLGHVVLELADFQSTCGWYTNNFGLIPSDVQVLPDGSPAVAFMRFDLGVEPADHHSIAFAQGLGPEFNHCAFELLDEDAVGMGQRFLREQKYKHAWGIGRHILGSQIFDYWNDPYGCKHEHYCDGDVFTSEVPLGVHSVNKKAMAQWGPTMPADFVRPKMTLPTALKALDSLRISPDLSIKKLIMLAKAML